MNINLLKTLTIVNNLTVTRPVQAAVHVMYSRQPQQRLAENNEYLFSIYNINDILIYLHNSKDK